MKKQIKLFVLLLLAAVPGVCYANSAVPGPVIYYGVFNTSLGTKWLVLSMLTCSVIEGVFFHITHSFHRPYYASVLLNCASVVAGIPCAMVGAIIADALLGSADIMIVATLLTIIVECLVALKMRKLRMVNDTVRSNKYTLISTVFANLISNAALFFLLIFMMGFYPPRRVFLRECFSNERRIHDAAHRFAKEHGGETYITIATDNLLPYLPDNKLPLCPFGGVYNVQSCLTNVHFCTHGRKDKPIRRHNNKQ